MEGDDYRMSNTIDQQVVQMKFDNSNFERNVKQSMGTLDKLKSALNFGDVAQNAAMQMHGVQERVNQFSMDNMANSLSMISSRFTTMGIIGTRILQNLTDKAMSFAANLYSSTIGQIKSGGISRAMNIENARFMVEGLNDADASWNALYEDINYGVQDTAYGLDAAAKVAAQLVASGIKAGDQMKSTLRGISGVAAMSNSSYEDIGSIYTTVASNGKLMTEQLRQFSYRGMNASATLAKYLNKSEADINEMVSNGEIDFATFAAAMDDAFGAHAKDANKTLSGVMMNIKAALSKIGADFVSPIIQQEGPLVNFLNTVKSKINDFRNALSTRDENGNLLSGFAKDVTDSLNNLLTGMNNVLSKLDFTNAFAGIVNIFYSVWNVLKGVLSVLKPVVEAFNDILPKGLDKSFLNFTKQLRECTSSMKLSDETAKKLHDTFYAFFSIIKTLATDAGKALSVIFDTLGNFFGKTGRSIANTGLDILSTAFSGLATGISKVSDILEPLKKGLGYVVEQIGENLPAAVSNLSGILGSVFSLGILSNVHQLTTMFGNSSPIISIFQQLALTLKNYQYTLSIDKIKGIAKALLILAGALFIISSIDSNKLASAVAVISALFFELAKATKSISANSKDTTKLKSAAIDALESIATISSMIGFSSALLLLAGSVKMLSTIEWDGLERGISGVTVLIVELTAVSKILATTKSENKKALKGMFGLIEVAVAVRLLVSSVKDLSKMDIPSMVQGMSGITVLVSELTIVAKILSSSKSDYRTESVANAFSLIEMVIAVRLLVSAIKKLSDMKPISLVQGLAGVTILLNELVAVSNRLSKAQTSLKVAIASSIVLITFTNQIKKIASIVSGLGEMDWTKMAQGLAGLTLIIGELYLSFKMISKFKSVDTTTLLEFVVILPLLASSIKTVAKAVTMIGELSFGSMISGLIGLAGGMTILCAGLLVLTALGPELLVAAESLTLLGAAVALAGVGVAAAGTGLLMFTSAMNGMVNTAKLWGQTLADLFTGIALKLPEILPAIKEIILGVISVFTECIPALTSGLLQMWISTLQGVKDNAPTLINLVFDIIIDIFNTLSTRLPELTEPLTKFVSALIDLLCSVFNEVSKKVDVQSLVTLVGEMTAICLGMAALKTFGKAAMEGVIYFGIIVTELIGVLELLGLFLNNDTLLNLIEGGGEVLGKLGEAIGKLIGGIVGGGLEQMSESLPSVGENLSSFMKSAQPFFEGLSDIDEGTIESVKDLVKIFMMLTANDILAGDFGIFGTINKFLDNKLGTGTMTNFAEQLVDLGKGLKKFSKTTKGIDSDSITKAVSSLKQIKKLASSFNSKDSAFDKLTGNDQLTKVGEFTTEAVALGKSLKKFSNSVKAISAENISIASNCLNTLIKAAKPISKTNVNADSLASFSKSLPTLGANLRVYSDTIGSAPLNIDNMNNATNVATGIANLAKKVTSIKGLTNIFNGGNFNSFMSMLPSFGLNVRAYSNNIGADALNIDNMNNATNVATGIANLAKKVTGIKDLTNVFNGGNFNSFMSMLPSFGLNVRAYSNSIGADALNIDNMNNAVATMPAIVEVAKNVSAIDNLTSVWNGGNFNALISMLPSLGTYLKNFSNNIGKTALNTDNINAAVATLPAIVEVAKTISAIKSFTTSGDGASNFTTLISQLPTLGTNLNTFATAVTGFTDLQASATAAVDTLKYIVSVFSDVKATNAEAVSSFATGLTDLANANIQGFVDAFSNAGDSVKSAITGLLDTAVSALDGYKDKFKELGTSLSKQFVEGIKSQQDSSTEAGKALGKNAKDGARTKYDKFYIAGAYLVDGFCTGISDNGYKAVAAGTSLGESALEAAKKAVDERSPSHEMYKVGDFFVRGFANGISETADSAISTAFDMARSTMSAVTGVIDGSTVDTSMAITPVLDTSNMSQYSWSGIMNGSLGDLSFTEQTQSMLDMCREIQNGIIDSNNKVINAIDELRTDMGMYYNDSNAEVSLYLDQTKLGSAISKNFTKQMSALNKLK